MAELICKNSAPLLVVCVVLIGIIILCEKL